jgi:hypothetical protein
MKFDIKRGDTSPALSRVLRDGNGAAINLVGATVVFSMWLRGAPATINKAAATVGPANGQVVYAWQVGDTAQAGAYFGEFKVTYADGTIETFPNDSNMVILVNQGM